MESGSPLPPYYLDNLTRAFLPNSYKSGGKKRGTQSPSSKPSPNEPRSESASPSSRNISCTMKEDRGGDANTATFNDAKSSLTNDSTLDHVASMVHTTINQKVRDSVVNYVLCAYIISQQDI